MNDTQTKDIREGNLRAYYQVFEEYHLKLYRYIYKYTQSAYYADETVQLSFIKLWEKREGLSEQYSISSQLFRIAKSILIDLIRKEKIRDTQELSDVFISDTREDEKFLYKEELRHILSSIDGLPPQSRQVFKLSRLDHLSHKEISAQLSISPKTIETHISKAIKYLRKSLSIFL
ncbi:MAG: RNA polymerase sigma-70 factor [Bacteroidota bacterium]|nr:RNA polymerase sigma-70 factor [Bacteroidota bacterium]MDP4211033.1 RNA polymerase sigma-70 factor [Bacteroidota bacterium]MDP4248745.1 RNA polymerase sigma-70 factor [Bacteroidota bacterium]